MDDLYETMRAFPQINYWYLVMPKEKLPSGMIPLDFDPVKTKEMIRWGQEDAKKAMNEGKSFSKIFN